MKKKALSCDQKAARREMKARRAAIVTEERIDGDWRRPVKVARNTAAWPIDLLLRRGLLTPRQHQAAAWYRAMYERARLRQRVVSSWEAPVDGGGAETSPIEAQLAARKALQAARERLRPEEVRQAFEWIVIDGTSTADIGARAGYATPAQATSAGMTLLRVGCDLIAEHLRT